MLHAEELLAASGNDQPKELFRDDHIVIERCHTSQESKQEASVKLVLDITEVEMYRRQILELTETNRQLTAAIQKSKEPVQPIRHSGHESDEEAVHIEHEQEFMEICTQTETCVPEETVEVLLELKEVEIQTEVGFESMMRRNLTEFEMRLRKTEAEKGELAKELSNVRKNLLESQRKTFKDKEISQQAYSALVRKYEDDCSKFAQ